MTDRPARPQAEPTYDKPLNGPRRGHLKPVLYLIAFVAVLALLYWFGVTVLVPAH